MIGSNFRFVQEPILRQNLDEEFDHILILLPFSESITYNDVAKSAFRKTIIIYTASIIEALLFHVLDCLFSNDDIKQHYATWEFKDKHVLHKVDDFHVIIAGHQKKVPGKLGKEKLNLGQIADILKTKEVLPGDLFKKIDEVRKLRNNQHIGSHKKVMTYAKADLEKAFSVAREVKDFAKNKCT